MFFVYVLYSDEYNKIYIGYTSDIEARLAHHNHPGNRGWTSRYQPWRIIHTEAYVTKKDAMIRERQLKSARGRQFVKSIVPLR
jgi:putative endonuclease